MDEVDEGQKIVQYLTTLAASMCALSSGSAGGWSSPSAPMMVDGVDMKFKVTDEDMSWIAPIMQLGCAAASFPFPLMVHEFGKQFSLLVMVIPASLGWALICFANDVKMLLWGRFLLGIAIGSFTMGAPSYITEISCKSIRGRLLTFFQIMYAFGIFFVYSLGFFVGVNFLNRICALFPIIFFIFFSCTPETPNFYLHRGLKTSAIKSFRFLRGAHFDPTPNIAEIELLEVDAVETKEPLCVLLSQKVHLKPLGIAMGLLFFQQATGIIVVLFFTSDILGTARDIVNPKIGTIVIGAMHVVATIFSCLIVDKCGRRILMLISQSVVTLCNILLGTYYFLDEHYAWVTKGYSVVPIVLLSIFIVLYAVGMSTVPTVLTGEIFRADISNFAGPVCSFVSRLLSFAIGKTFNDFDNAFGVGVTFWIYAVLSLLGLLFIIFCIPETKGKSLLEIQEIFEK